LPVTDREFQLLLDGIIEIKAALRDHRQDVEKQRERTNQQFSEIRSELQEIKVWRGYMMGMGGAAGAIMALLYELGKTLFGGHGGK
jgi:hypothetical protein